ncbi:MAG: hypothetical protein MRECE_19c012 [Mycoplasmataceae bacterium CE_OT135]|nr:MAG: hypothetical protein MRECE_19c012 [Mycoplasmataceae bacterium CE_OT135]
MDKNGWNSGNKKKEPQAEQDQIQQLQEQVDFWSKAAQTHLTNLQRTTAQLDQAEERIKELETQPNQLSQETEQALKEANQRIRELEAKNKQLVEKYSQPEKQSKNTANTKPETKTFTCSDCQQTKSHQELSRQFNKFSFCRTCSKKARATAQEQKTQFFTCANCEQTQPGTPTKMKLDKTLQAYPICSDCRPTLKEFNEADLITDELWTKYPYCSASEILEKEFNLKKEEPW